MSAPARAEVEYAMRDMLANDALVNSLTAGRIYPLRIPQEVVGDVLTYQRVDSPQENVHGSAASLARPRIQVTAWSKTYAGARRLGLAAKAVLDGRAGDLTTNEGGLVTGAAILCLNGFDDFDPETQLCKYVQDFLAWNNV